MTALILIFNLFLASLLGFSKEESDILQHVDLEILLTTQSGDGINRKSEIYVQNSECKNSCEQSFDLKDRSVKIIPQGIQSLIYKDKLSASTIDQMSLKFSIYEFLAREPDTGSTGTMMDMGYALVAISFRGVNMLFKETILKDFYWEIDEQSKSKLLRGETVEFLTLTDSAEVRIILRPSLHSNVE